MAFYATALTYRAVLDLHGWDQEREAIRAAFKTFDIAGMGAAVSDEMLEQIAVFGTPDECKERLQQWEGLLNHVLLDPPAFGVRPRAVERELPADFRDVR